MSTTEISRSTKMRSGARMVFENGKLVKKHDGLPRNWKQVVIKTPTGLKTKKGKPAFESKTKHVPA